MPPPSTPPFEPQPTEPGLVLAPMPGGGGDEEQSIDIRRYIEALRKRYWLVLLAVVICGGISAAYTMRQPRLYQAAATVIIDTHTAKVLTGVTDVVSMGTGGYWANEAFYQKEYTVIRSRAVARRAGEKLGVLADDERTGLAAIADPAEREKERAKLDAADFVFGRYTVTPAQSQNVVQISVVDTDPQNAADMANAVAEAYVELNLEKKVQGTEEAATWLAVQHRELKEKLEESEKSLEDFMERENVLNASIESQLEEVMQRLQSFNGKLAEVQADRIRGQLEAQALKDVREGKAPIDSIAAVREGGVIPALKTKLIELKSQKTELLGRYQEAHPRVQALNEQISIVQTSLSDELDAILLSLERKRNSLESTEAGLKDAIAAERAREARLNKLSLDYKRLKREVDTNAKLYDMVTTRMKETDLSGALRLNNVTILDRARKPGGAFKPSFRNNLMLGLLVGLLLGIALAIGLDLLDNTVKSQEDVENILGVSFLGMMPSLEADKVPSGTDPKATSARDLFVLNNPKSSSAECARFIRTNLMFMSPDKPLQTLVVTSAGPQEGKTTTVVSLAITMAQSGSKTLIIDTDMRRPRLHRAFGVSNERGISSVIVGECELSDAIQATDAPDLDVLVCGPIPPNPSELLHTESFTKLVQELKSRYDRILFDSPPVGAVTDPVILGTQADGTVMVLKAQRTSRDAAKQALRAMRDANVPVLGAVLNDVDLTSNRYGGSYYAYYRKYGYYYGESPTTATGEA